MSAEREQQALKHLMSTAGTFTCACGGYLGSLSEINRQEIYTSLAFDRLERKMHMVDALYEEAEENWNQTFYLLYFRTLGDKKNQEAFLELARRVPYKIVLRERGAKMAIETMLLGASGLLALYKHDTYTLDMARDFEYFAQKYKIVPMDASEWELANVRPANHPVLRIAQAAEFLGQDEFLVDKVMACRREGDIRRIFCVEASEYWRTHHIPGTKSDESAKRLGAFKANIIGINLVAVLQFAYGGYTGSESLRTSAISLLEHLPAEENRYVNFWHGTGAPQRNAFETQALLQLATEYCDARKCADCPTGRRILKTMAGE